MYFEDIDLSGRIRAKGWKFLLIPQAEALHRSGSSSNRESAMKWELSSSVILTRKFLSKNSSELPKYWKKREKRIWLSSIRRGEKWLWRVKCIRDAMKIPVESITIGKDILSEITASRPQLMPYPRPENHEGVFFDESGLIEPGPGWSIPGNIINGVCGCLTVPVRKGLLGFRISAPQNGGTVSVRIDGRTVHRCFAGGKRSPELSIHIPLNCTAVYIVPDDMTQKIRVTDFKYETY